MFNIVISIIGFFTLFLILKNSFKRKAMIESLFYFTNISVFFISVYYLTNLSIPILHLSFTLYMVITGIMFNLVILPYGRINNIKLKDIGVSYLSGFLAHDLMPVLVIINFYISNETMHINYLIYTLIFPIIYFCFCIFIGKSGYQLNENPTNYVYPFFDIDKLGIKKVLLILIGLIIFFLLIGYVLIITKQ